MSDLCAEDIVVRFNNDSPPDISVEAETSAVCADTLMQGDSTGRMTSSGAMELGRRLLAAARDGDTTTVLDLMAKGAPFTTDWLGTSPLHLAAANNQSGVCAVLLRAGVSRDSRTKVERTPLHLAAYWGHAPTAQLLLENNADVNCRDMLGMTPLHWAVERGHYECAQVLLCSGADPCATSRFRTTPRQLAEEVGGEMQKLVEDALNSREAGDSVESIVNDEDKQDEHIIPTEFVSVESAMDYNTCIKEKRKKSHSESQNNSSQDKSTEESGAAKLLRSHGITLLPTDDGNTVLNAIQSGRTILLSDAGKLMLKESETISPPKSTGGGTPMVLTATPVKSTPRAGVKIFTLGNNSKMTLNKLSSNDQQIKYVTLPQDGKITSPSKMLKVVKTKKQQSTVIPISALRRLQKAGGAGGAVKILMNKGNLHKLIANANKANVVEVADEQPLQMNQLEATPADTQSEDENIVRVPEQFLRSGDPEYLRAQLLAAHAALHRANTQLAACKQRLSQYEPVD